MDLFAGTRWLLGLFVAAAIAFIWQKRGWLFQQKLKRASDKHESQLELIRNLFLLVDKRIYVSRMYLDALISDDSVEVDEHRKLYRAVVQEWNENISGLSTFIRVRFNSQIAFNFDGYFLPAFQEVDQKLRAKRIKSPIYDSREITRLIRADLERINAHARDFQNEMYQKTTDTLRIIEEAPEVAFSNIAELDRLYLIKHLFKRRSDF